MDFLEEIKKFFYNLYVDVWNHCIDYVHGIPFRHYPENKDQYNAEVDSFNEAYHLEDE